MKKDFLSSLSDRAMLASVKISLWHARKYDPKVTKDANNLHKAADGAGRYTKRLVEPAAIQTVTTIASRIRREHYHRTLPWLDGGERLLSVEGHADFTEEMRKLREEWDSAVSAFVSNYPLYVRQAKTALNGMFDPNDYPGPTEIGNKFALDVNLLPVPDSNDFRAQVSDIQAAMIKENIERVTKDAVAGAVRDTYGRIAEVVTHMSEKLANYKPDTAKKGGDKIGAFRDSLVGNIKELVEVLPSLNITDDPHITGMVDRLKSLCDVEPQVLRVSEKARQSVQEAAAAIAADVQDYI